MDNTGEYVKKLRETERKQEKNRKQGAGAPSAKLPTKQHTDNP